MSGCNCCDCPNNRDRKNQDLRWLGFDSMSGRLLAGIGDNKVLKVSGLIPQRSTALVVASPQIASFRGWRLFVHRPCASDFLIHDIRVGSRSTTAAAAPIPADAFITNMDRLAEVQQLFEKDGEFTMTVDMKGAELLGTEWCLPICLVGMNITMTVENVSTEPKRFVAGFLGFGPGHF